jgi:hypothetical protein
MDCNAESVTFVEDLNNCLRINLNTNDLPSGHEYVIRQCLRGSSRAKCWRQMLSCAIRKSRARRGYGCFYFLNKLKAEGKAASVR